MEPSVIVIDPEIMSGAPCFSGTRVTAQSFIDYLDAGRSLADFLEDFPTVTAGQANQFLRETSLGRDYHAAVGAIDFPRSKDGPREIEF